MKKVGLALGSGGVRGLAHVGVIKTLLKHQIPIDFISGSSIGAWVGAHYALFQDIEKLEEITAGKKQEKLLSFLEPTFTGGLIKGDKLEKLLNNWLNHATFNDLSIPLKMVATDLTNGEPVILDTGALAPAIHASMAIPGLFQPVKNKEKILVDGGICNPVPDEVVKNMGAKIIISVNLDDFRMDDDINKKRWSLGEITYRTIKIMRHNLAKNSLRNSDFIIEPRLAKYSSWKQYFTKGIEQEIVALGSKETEKIIPQLIKKLA